MSVEGSDPQSREATAQPVMSTERLVGSLVRVGEDEEAVYQMNRQQLLDAWAKVVIEGQDKPQTAAAAAVSSDAELSLQKQRLEFGKMKYTQESDVAQVRTQTERGRIEFAKGPGRQRE